MGNQNEVMAKYNQWLNHLTDDDLLQELNSISNDETEISDRFYKDLTFGTGGLRGILGVGTNRMNTVIVGKATQGIADYLKSDYENATELSVAISYDSRFKSQEFAHYTACVFAANGIKVYIYPRLMPTPCLSFAVRELHCNAGVMITASHNPARYNGYKVYGADGCQITDLAAHTIYDSIQKVDPFSDVKNIEFEEAIKFNLIEYIDHSLESNFVDFVLKQSPLSKECSIDKNISIVYTPLHGTGREPVVRALNQYGFNNITMVKEQEMPDGAFTTCPYPNPEVKEAMTAGIETAKRVNADLVIATDPDCDRVGIAVRDADTYRLLSGNEVGVLLLDFICEQRIANRTMPKNPVFVKTIVTTDLATKVARSYDVETRNVLTGFKYIGEQIGLLENRGCVDDFIFGFEESYGYLSGSYVRDKDGVVGSFLIALMFAYYKNRHITLIDRLESLYSSFGKYVTNLQTYEFEGEEGIQKIDSIMNQIRNSDRFAGQEIVQKLDYLSGIDGLPKSNVIKLYLESGESVTIRPSGTEPKLKIYHEYCIR